jgi:hypothetical protein
VIKLAQKWRGASSSLFTNFQQIAAFSHPADAEKVVNFSHPGFHSVEACGGRVWKPHKKEFQGDH